MYLEDHQIHAEMMLLVAITAITRKIVILDASKIDPLTLFGIAAVVLSLASGYFFMRRGGQREK